MSRLQNVQQPDAAEQVLGAHGPMERSTFHKELFLTNLNLYPFVDDWLITEDWLSDSNSILPTMGYFATMGRWLHLNSNTKPDEHCLFTVLIGEMLTSALPVSWIRDQLESRATLVSSVQALISHMTVFPDLIPQYTRADYDLIYKEIILWPRGFLNNDDIPNGYPFKDRLTVDTNEPRFDPEANSWPENTVHIEGLTYKNAMICLYLISMNAAAWQRKTGLNVIVHTILAIVEKRIPLDDFIWKVKLSIEADLLLYIQKDVAIIPEVLPMYHRYYGGRITELNAPALFNLWETWIPNLPLRLLVTVQRAAGSELTIYFTICKALIQHPNFNWAEVVCHMETDWQIYKRDAGIIGNNQFYEFKQDLSTVKPIGYKNLGYVAKEILLKVDGDAFINLYFGWPKYVQNHHQAITAMIDRYVTNKTKERQAKLGNEIIKLRAALVAQKID